MAWRVLLCAFGTLIKLLMWLLIPRWLLGNRFASTDKMEPTDEGSWSVCGVTCGASGDKDVAFTDHDAVEALVSTNQTTPKQQAHKEHGAREHHASGSTVLPQLQRLDESVSTATQTTHRPEQQSSTSRILHKTSHSGQERLQQIEIEVQSRFMYESSSHSLALSPFKTTDKAWRQDAAASSPAVEARPEDLMISSPNGMQHGVEGAGMNLQVSVTVTRAHSPAWQR